MVLRLGAVFVITKMVMQTGKEKNISSLGEL